MTEAEWLSSDRPEYLFHVQNEEHGELSDRRRRLIGIAVCRALPPGLVEPSFIEQWLAVAERFAEQSAVELPGDILQEWGRLQLRPSESRTNDAMEALQQLARDIIHMAIFYAASARDPSTRARAYAVDLYLTHIVRDIIGNPFRPVTFAPEWRTDTAVSLASQMYESREFSAMPILADALQDAGCDHEGILSHCRGEGPHVRGCWVVDLVLGKE